MERAIEIVVKGWVQGVGFRYSCLAEARRLGLSGWVRNEPDGSVRIRVQGRAHQVDRLVEWARNGPPGASVTEFSMENLGMDPEIKGFSIH